MTKEIKNFLDEIKDDYGRFLYSYDFSDESITGSKIINYPACCLLSAQLISSFLYVHFSKGTKCIYDVISNGHGGYGFGHAWSTIDDEIVDFTHFQFEDCSRPLKNDEKVDEKEFKKIMDSMSYSYLKEEHIYAPYENLDLDNFQEQPLMAIEYAKKYKPTKEGFLKFLNEAIQIEKRISYK